MKEDIRIYHYGHTPNIYELIFVNPILTITSAIKEGVFTHLGVEIKIMLDEKSVDNLIKKFQEARAAYDADEKHKK